ncbi:hypothetical protein CW745_04655 [Psychromonas sp. psych-6C06]|uniref:hypothetical protein n=1 Tax=Psychromonas sp. psych-6C06 TaxID=2058089 RepID=UPI000C31F6CC|nr:hypothetical protein [Psychromonas sp. psych-6C06]PKF62716.1 hypothetical protein CW745_04655 [Psychromonas sp. psych-6C06]
MSVLLWVVAVLVFVACIPIAVLFSNLVFISEITEFKSQRGADFEVNSEFISIKELENHSKQVIDAEKAVNFDVNNSDLPVGIEMVLTGSGEIKENEPFNRHEDDKPALQLTLEKSLRQLLFVGNKVYQQDGDELGPLLHQFNEFSHFSFVNYIDENTILIVASLAEFQHVENRLWQVNLSDFSKMLLSSDPYFTFSRPPKTITPAGSASVIVIYYSGNYAFGHGGHSSRPKQSTIRLYSPKYLQGNELVMINYKGGTVIDARFEGESIVLTADPSRPFTVDDRERPARFWSVGGY